MERPSGIEPTLRPELSEEQWQICAQLLWEQAEATALRRSELESALEALYEELAAQDVTKLSLHQRELRADQETEYWDLFSELQNLIDTENSLLTTLERVESRTAALEEIWTLLNTEPVEDSGGKTIDKSSRKKVARRRPRGENRGRLNSKGIKPHEAMQEFFDATAGTHGGKLRRPGKSERYYFDKGGHKIRKR